MSRKTGRNQRIQLHGRGNVACPICFNAFTIEETTAGKIVTLEHVPPKFIGGRARCLTCKKCNTNAGQNIDQVAAISKQPTKVTVNIMGRRDSFYLTNEGKEITPAFGGYTPQDIRNLKNSKSGTFTMSVNIPNREAVDTSWLKAAYLAIFSLLGPVEGYDYVRGNPLSAIRQQILDPLNQRSITKYVIASPENMPDSDIILVSQPVSCWMVKIENKIVVLPCNGYNASDEPLRELKRHGEMNNGSVLCQGDASWMFQTFGTFHTIRVNLEGASTINSLLGLTIKGKLPNGKSVEGTCINHMGESATLLSKDRIPL